MKRRLETIKALEHVHHAKHKKLDLRNCSTQSAFSCQKFEFGLSHPTENITSHSTDTPKEVKHEHEEVREVILAGLEEMYERGVPDYAIIHFYLNCEGMDQTFIFSGSGPRRKTLRQLRQGHDLDEIIDKFALMIQSGRNVTLDNNTRLVFYAFIPPTQYR